MSRLFGALVGAGLVVGAFVIADMAYSRHDIVFENASLGELAQSAFLLFIFIGGGYTGVRLLVASLSKD
jgi:hypothetical protein